MKQHIPQRRTRRKAMAWQIIYMDLMTIIMVFFVILWSINQGSDEGVTDSIGDETARMVNLPSDILFASGRAQVTEQGQQVFTQLFADADGAVLDFDTGELTRRHLMVHGHTDRVGNKDENFLLGFKRAFAAYKEIEKHGADVADHVILCSHADNSPAEQTPAFQGKLTPAQKEVLEAAKSSNRRIMIEDKIISTVKED